MHISDYEPSDLATVTKMFTATFSASEGEEEGTTIGTLVNDMLTTTNKRDIYAFKMMENNSIVGCIFFTRFNLPTDDLAFILSPLAVSTNQQGKGVGQALINFGLEQLKEDDVQLVFTYGDPAFYCKTGFSHVTEATINAPFPLTQPHGWLCQSLTGQEIEAIEGGTHCVEALSKAKYW